MAYNSYKKDFQNIHKRIDKIAKGGSDNWNDWSEYFDSMIIKGEYSLLTEVLRIKYNFDSEPFFSSNDVKLKSWKSILFLTKPKIQEDIYSLLQSENVYQIGKFIFGTSSKLGEITELDSYENNISNLSYTSDEFQKKSKNKSTYLLVDKIGSTSSVTFDNWDFTKSYENNLLNLYKSVITYLKS